MKLFVGITDGDWFKTLANLTDLDEVNFWQPSGKTIFRALQPGEPFLFKLHSPQNFIVGGGYFVYSTILPSSLAWDAFGEKNGAHSLEEKRNRIIKYRRNVYDRHEDFQVGCILLKNPFFLEKSEWIPVPEWSTNIVIGKGYDMNSEPGRSLWKKVQLIISRREDFLTTEPRVDEDRARFSNGILVKPRLGQGSFKILVTDAYNRSCAVTQEKALPVLEAVHIKPYSKGGDHRIDNGILFRSDIHKLFDKGYMTISSNLNIEVSKRIREEFENGKYYYTFHGNQIHSPVNPTNQPSKEFLIWHNENVFKE